MLLHPPICYTLKYQNQCESQDCPYFHPKWLENFVPSKKKKVNDGFSYTSKNNDNFLRIESIKKLIKNNFN